MRFQLLLLDQPCCLPNLQLLRCHDKKYTRSFQPRQTSFIYTMQCWVSLWILCPDLVWVGRIADWQGRWWEVEVPEWCCSMEYAQPRGSNNSISRPPSTSPCSDFLGLVPDFCCSKTKFHCLPIKLLAWCPKNSVQFCLPIGLVGFLPS